MAHTERGAQLTASHHEAQMSLSVSLVEAIRDLFLSIFDPSDIDGSSARFIAKAVPLVVEARGLSAKMATTYLDAFRKVELTGLVDAASLDPTDPLTVPLDVLKDMVAEELLEQDDLDQLSDSVIEALPSSGQLAKELHSAGAAVAKKKLASGSSIDEAKDVAAKAVASKVVQQVADGGRAPLLQETDRGSHGCVGYARVVDDDPCPFCAMLASRGAVYRADSFADSNGLFSGDGRFKVHPGCGCTLEPIYGGRITGLPPQSKKLMDEWAEIAAGHEDPWGAWRRYKQSGTLPGEERSDVDTSESSPSAPQYGRKKKGPKRRRQVQDMGLEEAEKTLQGLYVKRAALERQLGELEARGVSVLEPGPAQAIQVQLERTERYISHAQRRIAILS